MTETRWTSGPYTVRLVKGSYQRPALVMAGDKVIASCMGDQLDPGATSIAEATANATLIAAAPELFEALIHAERQLDESHAYILCDSEHEIPLAAGNELALRQARAALAKARGE